MNYSKFLAEFRERGFGIAPASAPSALEELRSIIFDEAQGLCEAKTNDAETFMNNFHERKLEGAALNEFRSTLIRRFNERTDVPATIFQAFEEVLVALVGSDVAVQKSCNLVIQQPHDVEVSPIHRDAPPNSPFEVVMWIPLVDCYDTKGMSVLGRTETTALIGRLNAAPAGNPSQAYRYAAEAGTPVSMVFGEALFFWTGLYHVIPTNVEQETRWSLNIRYKNLFSPYGDKGFPDFFRILKLSPLSELAINADQKRSLG